MSVYITTFYSFAKPRALYSHGYSKFGSGPGGIRIVL